MVICHHVWILLAQGGGTAAGSVPLLFGDGHPPLPIVNSASQIAISPQFTEEKNWFAR